MKKLLLILFLFSSCIPAMACLNYFYTVDNEGKLHDAGDAMKAFNINFDKKLNVRKLLALENKLKQEHSFMLLSDYAICLMKLGKPDKALEILKDLYVYYPGEYKIASNLGTAYELNGMNDSALKYIRRGIGINPMDHEGSEWVHVKVLETKLALLKDPSYLRHHTVLELSSAKEHDSAVCAQINIQVRERFPFTPGPDPLMASLLLDLGDCSANTVSIEFARVVYQLAQKYYGDSSAEVRDKIMAMQKLMKKYIAVNPQQERGRQMMEGEHTRLGPLSYDRMLDDHQKEAYEVNWSKINTDVASLLALANLNMSVAQAYTKVLKDTGTPEELQPAEDLAVANSTNVAGRGPVSEKGMGGHWGICFLVLLLVAGGILFFRKRKRKQ